MTVTIKSHMHAVFNTNVQYSYGFFYIQIQLKNRALLANVNIIYRLTVQGHTFWTTLYVRFSFSRINSAISTRTVMCRINYYARIAQDYNMVLS